MVLKIKMIAIIEYNGKLKDWSAEVLKTSFSNCDQVYRGRAELTLNLCYSIKVADKFFFEGTKRAKIRDSSARKAPPRKGIRQL